MLTSDETVPPPLVIYAISIRSRFRVCLSHLIILPHIIPCNPSAAKITASTSGIRRLPYTLRSPYACSLGCLHILRHPSNAFAISYKMKNKQNPVVVCHHSIISKLTLPHYNTTHKNLDRADPLQEHLALSRCLPQPELMPQFLFTDGVWMIDFIA